MALHNTKGFLPVTAAIGGNLFVTIIKFVAAGMSGSSSMLSEAVHSFADTVNQVLLLIGLGRSTKKADDYFEYGYGNERFFWALISACGVLFVGAGVTAYNGILALSTPYELELSSFVLGVLPVALVVESYTFLIAARALKRDFPFATWRERTALADPSTLSVFLEDAVAVIGIFVASVSIVLSYYTGNVIWDSLGSILIAVLLGAVAITLIVKNRSYLIGKTMPDEMQEEVTELLLSEAVVEKVIDFKSVTIGFGLYRIKCEIEFNGSALLREAYRAQSLRMQYEEIHADFEEFKKFCVDYADRIPRLIGKKIDDIESRIKKLHPSIRHIDIEIN